ncbi:MAG: ABC transporter permease [bacterium]
MQQIFYLIQKEFRQIFRDPAMVFIMFFAPLVQMVVLGFAITVDVKNVRTIIADYDNSAVSREIARTFENNPYFSVVGYTKGTTAIRKEIDDWRAQVALVIPHHFGRKLERGLRPGIQLIVDGVDGNTAGIALGYAQGILNELARTSPYNYGLQRGFAHPNAGSLMPRVSVVEPRTRMWYNLDLESKNYMVPGLIAVLLTMLSMFLSSMGLVREKEMGTLEQLMVTPIKTWQLILGKVLPFLILAFCELGLMLTIAFAVFQLKVAGSLLLLFSLAALYLLSTLGLGIFISTLAQTQQQAMFISWFFMIFLIFMSGFLFPIANMPPLVQSLTYLDPMRYFVIILREIFLKGSSARFLAHEILSLAAFGAVILGMSSLRFQKRVS